MASNSSTLFDCLPDELVEYIFLLVVYSPPIEPFNHVNISPSSFYFSYNIHEPYLRLANKDLVSLKMVCHRFHDLIHSSRFWLKKCHHDHVPIINEPLAISKGIDFERLYFSNPLHPDYNLLDFHENKQDIDQYWSGTVKCEPIPIGSEQLYDAFGQVSSCYATSHNWGHYQRDNIQLLRKGEEKLIAANPVIEFSLCVAGRIDCSSTCKIKLHLSDDHVWRYERSFLNGDNKWHRITYRYMNYRENQMPSHVSIHLQGRDLQTWAGNYGAKFAQMKLRLALRKENETENQEFEETIVEPENLDLGKNS